ncbi:unnamed protein product [Brassica rapa]|uniref:Uncharacterized protein n=2 Tax=Brassica TaxID=3705 RepID=A0A8D9GQZ9_BRACM|nr:unnamed protein product [Brassica napus]CAG7885230.1 unnamed protein product [Brassica rapa]
MCDGLIAFPTLTFIITTMTSKKLLPVYSLKPFFTPILPDSASESIATTNVGAGELRSDPLIPVTSR